MAMEDNKQKQCCSLEDFRDLVSYFQVTVLLTDQNWIEFDFPVTKDERRQIKNNQAYVDAMYPRPTVVKSHEQMNHETRHILRSLVGNPRFHRLTTFTQHADTFFKWRDGKTVYGCQRLTKKANENLRAHFETHDKAREFFELVLADADCREVSV